MSVKSPCIEIEIGDKILKTSNIKNLKRNPNFQNDHVLYFNVVSTACESFFEFFFEFDFSIFFFFEFDFSENCVSLVTAKYVYFYFPFRCLFEYLDALNFIVYLS